MLDERNETLKLFNYFMLFVTCGLLLCPYILRCFSDTVILLSGD